MIKVSTLFKKNPSNLSLVIDELAPENTWVTIDDAIPTRKRDGTAVLIKDGAPHKRLDVRGKMVAPVEALPCQPYPDPITKHHPHWMPCDRENTSDKYVYEAFDRQNSLDDGTYELCGPKVGTRDYVNGENLDFHVLYKHGAEVIPLTDLSFESLKDFLSDTELDIEGIVFHHKTDGRMCKIRKKDFGVCR